jgi:hypothetical protein
MATEVLPTEMSLTPREVKEQLRIHGWCWKSGGAVFGLCLGLVAPCAGAALTVIAWFTGGHWHGFFIGRYGVVLFFLTIPLLIFGAHCLDLMDQEDEERRVTHINYLAGRFGVGKGKKQ